MKKLIIFSLVLLAGCDLFQPAVPQCYHSETKKLVEQILADNPMFKQFNIRIDSTYETNYSNRIRYCTAMITYNPTTSKASEAVDEIKLIFGNELTYTIKIIKDGPLSYKQLVEIQ